VRQFEYWHHDEEQQQAEVDNLVGAELRKLDREYLLAIYLTSRNKVIDIEVLAIGTLSQVLVHPREVIKSAILANAPALELRASTKKNSTKPSTKNVFLENTLLIKSKSGA
jgi:DNA repair protein RadC